MGDSGEERWRLWLRGCGRLGRCSLSGDCRGRGRAGRSCLRRVVEGDTSDEFCLKQNYVSKVTSTESSERINIKFSEGLAEFDSLGSSSSQSLKDIPSWVIAWISV